MKKMISILLFSSFYSIIRYNIFGDVPYGQIPLFILNKSVSFAGIVLLCLSLLKKENFFRTGSNLILLHVVISMIIISSKYFPKLYDNGYLTSSAQISILAGSIAFLISVNFLINNLRVSLKETRIYTIIFLLLVNLHLFFLGYKGWLDYQSWHGYLPPISLLSFIVSSISLVKYPAGFKKK